MGTGLKCLKIGQNNPVPICLREEGRGEIERKEQRREGKRQKTVAKREEKAIKRKMDGDVSLSLNVQKLDNLTPSLFV